MSESKFETVSSLVDSYQLTESQLKKVMHDDELTETWDNYHLIGDIMRGDIPEAIQLDLSQTIAASIADEPTVLAPMPTSKMATVKANVVKLIKPFGQVAIAASAAGLMILGVQQTNVADNTNAVPSQVIQTMPLTGTADPVSYSVSQPDRAAQQEAYLKQQRRFQALLSDYNQQVKLNKSIEEVQQTKETQSKVK